MHSPNPAVAPPTVSRDICEAILRDFVGKVANTLTHAEGPVRREQLVPTIRPAAYVDGLKQTAPNDLAAEPLAGDRWIVFAIDSPDRVRIASRADLAALGLGADEARRVATQNLGARLKPPREVQRPATDEVVVLASGNFFESSRLLQTDAWVELVRGRREMLLAAAPARDVVLFMFAPEGDSGMKLAKAARIVFERAPSLLSTVVLRWTPNGWVQHAPP